MQYKRVLIRNFQSIKEMELHFKENRCYHFKGDNNIGKSAFFKALDIIEKNIHRNIDHYIRDYADSFLIEVEDFENQIVTLSRGKEDYYEWYIKGQKGRVDGTAGKVPPQVTEFFNFYKDMEKSKQNVNIRLARSNLLFIDTTNGENYYLLQKALGIEEGLAAIKLGESEKKKTKKEIEVIDSKIIDTENQLTELVDYTLLLNDLTHYENVIDMYYGNIELLSKVSELYDIISNRESLLDRLGIEYDADYVKDLAEQVKLIDEVLTLTEKVIQSERKVHAYNEVLEEFELVKPLFEEWSTLNQAVPLVNRTEELKHAVKDAEHRQSVYKQTLLSCDALNLDESMETVQLLQETLNTYSKFENQKIQVEKLNEDVLKEEELRKRFMVENKFCPVVVSMIDQTCPFSNKTLEELLENK